MPLIHDSERVDFEQCIVAADLSVVDFELTEQEDAPIAKEQHPITGTVTVHRISTDNLITYRAGSGLVWPLDFATDLYAGKFGEL